jgi:hypoxanthine phosphoribosyltransferase
MKDDCSTQKSTAKRSLSYDMISGILLSQEVDQRAFAPDVVIGVARAGIVPSAMVATNLSLPLLSVSSNRTSHKVAWLLPPHPGTNLLGLRALIVDDFAGSGLTLQRVRKFLEGQGVCCCTNTIGYDSSNPAAKPDIGNGFSEWVLMPWDKKDITPGTLAKTDKLSGQVHYSMETDMVACDEAVAHLEGISEPWSVDLFRVSPVGVSIEELVAWLLSHGVSRYFTVDLRSAVEISKQLPVTDIIWCNGSERIRIGANNFGVKMHDLASVRP